MERKVVYKVTTQNPEPVPQTSPVADRMQEEWVTFKIIEDVLRNSKFVDHTVFDDL